MFLSFVYLAFSAVLKLLLGRRRSEFGNDVQLLGLRHQLVVLGRQAGRPSLRPAVPIRVPQANGYAERFVRTVRAECLDWLLILGRRHLESVLRVYTAHYNHERPHRGLALLTPETGDAAGLPTTERIDHRDRLGGLIHEYHRAAA